MYKEIGNRIRKARESKGISQRKLGMILGLSDKAISAYESNRTLPPIDTLYKISLELDQDITYFFIQNDSNQILLEKLTSIKNQLDSINKEFIDINNQITKK